MGQKSGEKGVKFSLRREFQDAFARFFTLEEFASALSYAPEQLLVAVDGNVLLRQIPTKIEKPATEHLPVHVGPTTLDDQVGILVKKVLNFFKATNIVVIVFDQPETITLAKEAEQKKRDGKDGEVATSSDLCTISDHYNLHALQTTPDLPKFVKERPRRPRYYDELLRQACQRVAGFVGRSGKTLVIDGLDERGALRPVGALRMPSSFGFGNNAAAMVQWFLDYDHTGEGDLKLPVVYERTLAAHKNEEAPEELRNIVGFTTYTIDTDDYVIQLLAVAAQDSADTLGAPVKRFVAVYEPSTKKSKSYDDGKSTFSICDVECLYKLLQERWFDEPFRKIRRNTEAEHRRELTNLFVAGCAMLRCDYVEKVDKLTFKRVLHVVSVYAETRDLEALRVCWQLGDRYNIRLLAAPVLVRFVNFEERTRKDLALREGELEAKTKNAVLQACWLLAYWNKKEIADDLNDFAIRVSPTSVDDRKEQQARRASVRVFLWLAVVRLRRSAQRAREAVAARPPLVVAMARKRPHVAAAAPAKRLCVVLPMGNG